MIINMEPVLKRGYTAWDQDVLPPDEFAERLSAVRAGLAARSLDALVIVNYSLLGAMFDYADVAYVGGLQSGGVIVVLPQADPVLLTFGGGRELFFTRTQTWIEKVVPGRGRTFEAARDLLAEHGLTSGRIGTTGLGDMPAAAEDRFRSTFTDFELEPFDAALGAFRLVKRPRELRALGIAKGIAERSVAAALATFADGGDNTAALLEAERIGRWNRARDVRVLVNMGTDGLRPFEGRQEGRHEPLLIWAAAQYQGYWAETAASSTGAADSAAGPALAAVDAMTGRIAGGVSAGMVAEAGLAALPRDLRTVAGQYGLGGTTGLAQCDGIEIRPGSDTPLPEGAVVSLTCCLPVGSAPDIANRTVVVTRAGCADLATVTPGE